MRKNPFPLIYELFIWILYAGLYKYSSLLDASHFPATGENFPYLQICLYAVLITLYVIPFYRWLGPYLLLKRWYFVFTMAAIIYFSFASQAWACLTSGGLALLNVDKDNYYAFYYYQYRRYQAVVGHFGFWQLELVVTDLIAFLSIAFMRYAFENERRKHLLERDNLSLQLESLKAQLHPHFLFNTLNSIYGMSLTGSKDTPSAILRLSDMMRFVLYDCRDAVVTLEKDIAFLQDYITMEEARYPEADIQFTISGVVDKQEIAPLLFIPFIENSFKHGSHRVVGKGFIHGKLEVTDTYCSMVLRNDFQALGRSGSGGGQNSVTSGGVGLENVKKRLALYYPGKHDLSIQHNNGIFEITLKVAL